MGYFRDILNMKSTKFDGTFDSDCQKAFAPPSFVLLVSAIMHGFLYETNSNIYYKQATSTKC